MSGLFTIMPRFAYPWALLLLLSVPWAVWLGIHLKSLSPLRRWTALALRTVILLAVIFALAGMELVKTSDRLAVFYLLDVSNSIPADLRGAARERIAENAAAYQSAKDDTGLIVFAGEPSIEFPPGGSLPEEPVRSEVDGNQTDLAAAVRLAMAAFPQGAMRRIVIVSDGNETQDSVLEEVKLAQAAGVEVNAVPLELGAPREVRMAQVRMPQRVDADEPFRLQVTVEAEQDCEGVLRVYQRTAGGRRLLRESPVTLQKGHNAFLLPQELPNPGFYEYEAVVETAADTITANNVGRGFTMIYGEPGVLFVGRDPAGDSVLREALAEEGLQVQYINPTDLPGNLLHLQQYGVLVLDNIPATDFTRDQLSGIEILVRDLGAGLVMVGGPDAYGAGGYYETPVERALPVSMDLKQRRVMPRGALVACLHTCEFPNGNAWAKEISLAALDVLSAQDLMGALAYDFERQDSWIFPLQPVGDKRVMRSRLSATTTIGDMPSMQPTLKMAYLALREADAAVKRVIMISDGDPAAPTIGLLNSMKRAGINVTTICIQPHQASDANRLEWIADVTGGEFYNVQNPNRLPQIFIKEASVVKQGLFIEEPFTPQLMHLSEITRGVADAGVPELTGYVVTTAKDNATLAMVSHKEDPILAQWRYGLGKSVAFTSDATARWAQDWLSWQGFRPFWSQAVRWALREAKPSDFRVETWRDGNRGYIRIDAVDAEGRYVNFLRPEGTLVGPGPDYKRSAVDLVQTGPGLYEGVFPVHDDGVYMLNATYEDAAGGRSTIPAGLAVGYSREYDQLTTNRTLIEEIANLGGGNVLPLDHDPYTHDLAATPTIMPVWMQLLMCALLLYPIEIFVRRVMFDFSALWAAASGILRRVPLAGRYVPATARRGARLTGRVETAAAAGRAYEHLAPDEVPIQEPGAGGVKEAAAGEEPSPLTTEEKPEYTSKLLAAKERALKDRKRRGGEKDA